MKYKPLPSKEELQTIFNYEPEGWLVWKKQLSGRGKVGERAGSRYKDKYISVCIRGERYSLHRLIWAYHYGEEGLEGYVIHHKDSNTSNNRIENLEKLTLEEHQEEHREEVYRGRKLKDNKTGFSGVSKRKSSYRWQICFKGKKYEQQGYTTPEEAYEARNNKLEVLLGN